MTRLKNWPLIVAGKYDRVLQQIRRRRLNRYKLAEKMSYLALMTIYILISMSYFQVWLKVKNREVVQSCFGQVKDEVKNNLNEVKFKTKSAGTARCMLTENS